MSTEIVIIIIGAAFILIAIGDSIKVGGTSLGLINGKLRIPLGAIGILLMIYGGYSYGAVNLQGQIEQPSVGKAIQVKYPVESVQVLTPVQGDSVECRILTKGVYPESHNKDLWVVLKPSNGKYYPQSDHTNTSYKRNGEWQVITRFGGDKAESYEVIVYETDAEATKFFSSTIQSWKDSGEYPGLKLEDIPGGANEVDRIAVSLMENCRGVF